jgi:hypothetical protein
MKLNFKQWLESQKPKPTKSQMKRLIKAKPPRPTSSDGGRTIYGGSF